jgi:formiminotetrahydrofolate cyclodeaminase
MNARTAALAAIYNVKINLSSIEDDSFVEKLAQELKDLQNQVVRVKA